VKREHVAVPPLFGDREYRCAVRPRYSAGSPAVVPDHVALQVASDERRDYERARSGAYGEAQQRRAERLGLRGVAYAFAESGSGKNFRWLVYDLVTGECSRRHHDSEITGKLGFRPYWDLPENARREVCKTGLNADYERTFWKLENLEWVEYQPELVRE
jgi:hypothetical protein